MPKDNRTKQNLRSRIAAAAARIMAQDGLDDFALAKRKAARQLGAHGVNALPDNAEVEDALREYLSIYQEDEQRERIRELRLTALEAMNALADFRPYLRGPVLKGTAGRYGEVDLQLFAEDSKQVELFLLNRGIRYETGEWRRHRGDAAGVPVFTIDWEGTAVRLAVYPINDERIATAQGKAPERLSASSLRQLMTAEDQQTQEGGPA